MFGLVHCDASLLARLNTDPRLFFVRSLVKNWLWPIITFFGSLTRWSLSACLCVVLLDRCDRQYSRHCRSHQASHDHVVDEQLSRCAGHRRHRLPAPHAHRQFFPASLLQRQHILRYSRHHLPAACRLLVEYERLADRDVHC